MPGICGLLFVWNFYFKNQTKIHKSWRKNANWKFRIQMFLMKEFHGKHINFANWVVFFLFLLSLSAGVSFLFYFFFIIFVASISIILLFFFFFLLALLVLSMCVCCVSIYCFEIFVFYFWLYFILLFCQRWLDFICICNRIT